MFYKMIIHTNKDEDAQSTNRKKHLLASICSTKLTKEFTTETSKTNEGVHALYKTSLQNFESQVQLVA